ncbi:MAG: 4'-phosphopantetheinyl transferase superfamily protein [Chitinophagales bacterium]|nr:4'-phosphopantetheinyl transferase superfamily protein [Chitinophagales bacterium]
MIEIQLFNATEQIVDEKLFDFLFHQLPLSMQKDVIAHTHWQDKCNIVVGKTILKNWLKDNNKVATLNNLQYEQKERPFFINVDFDFNISHSKEIVACAFSNNRVGLDIEKYRNIEVNHFQKYFNANELLQIMTAEKPLQQFFKFWTIKEAAIKYNGNGVAVLGDTEILDNEKVKCKEKILYYQLRNIVDGFSCCVVSKNEIEAIDIKVLSVEDLL